MNFNHTLSPVGVASGHPIKTRNLKRLPAFLEKLIPWAKAAPDGIFALRPNPKPPHQDIYTIVKPSLGPYENLSHRKAVMCEVLRVLAGCESSWNFEEGHDTNNPSEVTALTKSAGVFQISADSMPFSKELSNLVLKYNEDLNAIAFRKLMMSNPEFAFEYAARLLRFTDEHHGPIKRREIMPFLSRHSVKEFQSFL